MPHASPSAMRPSPRHGWRSLVAAVLLAATLPAPAQTLADEALVEALRGGGFNLYFRHAATEWSQSDHVDEPGDWESCDPDEVRQLSDEGREQARIVGEAMRALRVPVGGVYSSPYCRCVQTAQGMDIGEVQTTTDVMNLRAASFVGGRDAVIERARARLATPPAAGTNHVYVAHGNVGVNATTVYPGEGEGLVFRPLGEDGFEFVGRLDPQQWRALASRMAAGE